MNHTPRHGTARSLVALAGPLLWGAIELVALARSRWSSIARERTTPPKRGGLW